VSKAPFFWKESTPITGAPSFVASFFATVDLPDPPKPY